MATFTGDNENTFVDNYSRELIRSKNCPIRQFRRKIMELEKTDYPFFLAEVINFGNIQAKSG